MSSLEVSPLLVRVDLARLYGGLGCRLAETIGVNAKKGASLVLEFHISL